MYKTSISGFFNFLFLYTFSQTFGAIFVDKRSQKEHIQPPRSYFAANFVGTVQYLLHS